MIKPPALQKQTGNVYFKLSLLHSFIELNSYLFYLKFNFSSQIACKRNKKGKDCRAAYKSLVPNLQNSSNKRLLQGQFYQPEYVEKLLGLQSNSR